LGIVGGVVGSGIFVSVILLLAGLRLPRLRRLLPVPPGGTAAKPPDGPGRVLVLTAAIGGGHEAAGRAAAAELREAGFEAVVEDGLRAMSPRLSAALTRAYRDRARRSSGVLGLIFYLTSRRPVAAAVRATVGLLFSRRLLRVVGCQRPDAVVSTYPLVSAALGRLRRTGALEAPAVAVIADYGVHPLWVDPGLDLHLVASLRSGELAVRAGGLACLVRMPVDPAFRAAPPRPEARKVLGLPRDAFVALVVGGVWGIGDLEGAARGALAAGACAVVVAGENEELRRRLAERFAGEERARVFGWRDDMPVLMAAADCLIQNAGGMTCVEALEGGLPLVLFDPIRGHGELNARVMEREGVAHRADTPTELARLLRSAAAGETSLSALGRTERPPGVAQVLSVLMARARREASGR
jgi:processive 1,2-diacylglycerol beta-glucosyltransferase